MCVCTTRALNAMYISHHMPCTKVLNMGYIISYNLGYTLGVSKQWSVHIVVYTAVDKPTFVDVDKENLHYQSHGSWLMSVGLSLGLSHV